MLTIMSLFDGLGGFLLAGQMAGMKPIYASEIEKYPMAVSAARHDSSPCVDRGQNVVCYGVDCRNAALDEEKTHTIQAKANGGTSLNCTPSVCYRNSGFGGMVEGVGTLRANGGDAGGGTESIIIERV